MSQVSPHSNQVHLGGARDAVRKQMPQPPSGQAQTEVQPIDRGPELSQAQACDLPVEKTEQTPVEPNKTPAEPGPAYQPPEGTSGPLLMTEPRPILSFLTDARQREALLDWIAFDGRMNPNPRPESGETEQLLWDNPHFEAAARSFARGLEASGFQTRRSSLEQPLKLAGLEGQRVCLLAFDENKQPVSYQGYLEKVGQEGAIKLDTSDQTITDARVVMLGTQPRETYEFSRSAESRGYKQMAPYQTLGSLKADQRVTFLTRNEAGEYQPHQGRLQHTDGEKFQLEGHQGSFTLDDTLALHYEDGKIAYGREEQERHFEMNLERSNDRMERAETNWNPSDKAGRLINFLTQEDSGRWVQVSGEVVPNPEKTGSFTLKDPRTSMTSYSRFDFSGRAFDAQALDHVALERESAYLQRTAPVETSPEEPTAGKSWISRLFG